MKIKYNGVSVIDDVEWKIWTIVDKITVKNATGVREKVTRFYERRQSSNDYRWFWGEHEMFGESRYRLESRFGRQYENKKKDVTFQVMSVLKQQDLFGNEYHDGRMRYRRTEYTKLGNIWFSALRKSPIAFRLEEMFHYAITNNLIGQTLRISDFNKERIIES